MKVAVIKQECFDFYRFNVQEGFGSYNGIETPIFLDKAMEYLTPDHIINWEDTKVKPASTTLARKLRMGQSIQIVASLAWAVLIIAPASLALTVYKRNWLAMAASRAGSPYGILALSGIFSLLSIYGVGKLAQRFFHSTPAGYLDNDKARLKYVEKYVKTQKKCVEKYENLQTSGQIAQELKKIGVTSNDPEKLAPLLALYQQREQEEFNTKKQKVLIKGTGAEYDNAQRCLDLNMAMSRACRAFYIAVAKNPKFKGTMLTIGNKPSPVNESSAETMKLVTDDEVVFSFRDKEKAIAPLQLSELTGEKHLPIEKIVDRFLNAMA